jgi:hypothetical protein
VPICAKLRCTDIVLVPYLALNFLPVSIFGTQPERSRPAAEESLAYPGKPGPIFHHLVETRRWI